jgi:hypothetical protein
MYINIIKMNRKQKSIEEAPIRCRYCKDIIEVDKAGGGGVKQYEHWKCYKQ